MKQRAIITGIAGILVSGWCIHRVNHLFAFDKEITLGIAGLGILLLIWTVFKDRNDFISSHAIKSFIPTAIGLVCIAGLLGTLYLMAQRDRSPSLLYGVTPATDFNGLSIDFRKDGTYKLTSWGIGADFYRGKYLLQDSFILLQDEAAAKVLQSKRLLIRSAVDQGRSIYQVDKAGQIIPHTAGFKVIEGK